MPALGRKRTLNYLDPNPVTIRVEPLVRNLSTALARLIGGVPEAVVGGTSLIVFAIVGTMGIDMLRKVDLRHHGNMYVVSIALAVGLLPILVPGVYSHFPSGLAGLLGNGVAMGAFTAAVMNFLFHCVGRQPTSVDAKAKLTH